MLPYLGRVPYSIARNHDARSKHQCFFRGADDAVIRQLAQPGPIDGIDRSLVNSIEEVNVPPVQAYNPNLADWLGRRDFRGSLRRGG